MNDKIQHKIKHYMIISVLGIFAGLFVCFFSNFPQDNLWSFALFSSKSLGQWLLTCSLIVFFSKERKVAGISVGLYVYFMFFITGIGKLSRSINEGYNTLDFISVFDILLYGIVPAIACAVLALILFIAKKRNILGNMFLILPILFIIAEAGYMIFNVISNHTNLFMLLVDFTCIILYFYILKDEFRKIIKKSSN